MSLRAGPDLVLIRHCGSQITITAWQLASGKQQPAKGMHPSQHVTSTSKYAAGPQLGRPGSTSLGSEAKELAQVVVAEARSGAVAAVAADDTAEDLGGDVALLLLQLQDAVLDGVGHGEAQHAHLLLLADAVGAVGSLLLAQ